MKKKTTTLDIANHLEMSRTTVSKALNNHPSIPESTRRIVVETAMSLGYKQYKGLDVQEPEPIAAARETGYDTRTIAFLIQSSLDVFHGGFWGSVLRGVEEGTRQLGYDMIFNFVTPEDLQRRAVPQSVMNPQIGGLIMAGLHTREYTEALAAIRTPLVMIDTYYDLRVNDMVCDIVMAEGEQSAYDITSHLIELGHRDIGFVGDATNSRTFIERLHGYRRALLEAGLPINPAFSIVDRNPSSYFQYADLAQAMDGMKDYPTAFVCANDLVALLLIKYLNEAGLRVPDDISVSGFDRRNVPSDPFPQYPSLTTAEVNGAIIGARAFEQLLWRMEHPDRPFETVRVASRVHYGQSTQPPAVVGTEKCRA